MNKMKPQKQLLQFVMLALLSVVSVLVMANESFAVMDCASCHGDGINPATGQLRAGTDMRPLDTPPGSPIAYRNITTGAVTGNHSEHMTATMNPAMCNRCHNNAAYTTSHRSGTITLLNGMNFSASGTYSSPNLSNAGSYVFKNQTSVPTLGSCATVNCHFEKTTPTWGANPATVNCDTCHSSIPVSGSHAKHTAQYGGTASCVKCHAARPNFQHATSAGNVGRKIDLTQMVSGGPGTPGYTGSLTNYLPSQAKAYGSCSVNYCHSNAQGFNAASATPLNYYSPLWGNNGSMACDSCHQANLLNTGGHSKHIFADGNCGNCHTGATGATMSSATHVDGNIDVNGTFAVGYSQGLSSARGNGYGTCNNAACHSATTAPALVTPTWAQVATCESCHGGSVATILSGAHTKHNAMAGVTCANCHTSPGAVGHINNNIDVSQGYPAVVAKHTPGVYAATCTTTCHSADTTAVVTPTWGAKTTCASCHALSPATGAHTKHINAPVAAACAICHAGSTVGVSGGPGHGNGVVDVIQIAGGNTPKHAPGAYVATCSTNCHSTDNTTVLGTPSWGAIATCSSCHAASPATGDHPKHLAVPVSAACGTCHTGATAGVTGGNGHGNGTINVAQGYPSNVAKHAVNIFTGNCTTTCHNAYSTAVGIATPTWGMVAATCNSCHAASPVTGDHPKHLAFPVSASCGNCHTGATAGVTGGAGHGNGTIEVAGTLTTGYPVTAKHASGVYVSNCTTTCHNAYSTAVGIATPTWGMVTATCSSCHAASPVTGSHTKHVAHTIVTCGTCHTGATAGVTGGAGHGNGTIDVSVGGYPVAKAKGIAFSNCSNISCHNGGNAPDQFVAPAVAWGTALNCAGCHGYPPANTNHNGVVAGTCNSCHSNVVPGGTVTASTFVNVQLHLNGIVEGGKCNACHGYPPVQSMAGLGTSANYSSAKLENYSGGGGVHSVAGHLPKTLKYSQGYGFSAVPGATGCITCHPSNSHNESFGAFSTHNVQVVVLAQYKFDKNRPIVYNGKRSGTGPGKTSGTCTNVECHFQKSPIWSTETYTQTH